MTSAALRLPAPTAQPHALTGTLGEQLALVVAPSTGRFRPGDWQAGGAVEAGEVLGHVTGGRGRADAVHTPVRGVVGGVLVRSGQLVAAGQALVWLERTP